jgi:hypothetical protein
MSRLGSATCRALGTLAICSTLGACDGPLFEGASGGVSGTEPDGVERTGGYKYAVSWDEFMKTVQKQPWPGGKYVVEGDLGFDDMTAVRRYYDRRWRGSSSALTVHTQGAGGPDDLWPVAKRFDIRYCISQSSFGSDYQTLIDGMAIATDSWTQRIGVRWVHVQSLDGSCDGNTQGVEFDITKKPSPGGGGTVYGMPGDQRLRMDLGADVFGGGVASQYVLRHELGHTLGFLHEHVWATPGCGESPDSSSRAVTAYDTQSIMHYFCSGGGGSTQSLVDYRGAVILYGIAPSLTSVITNNIL